PSAKHHASCPRDWSSDVCSSDLDLGALLHQGLLALRIAGRVSAPAILDPKSQEALVKEGAEINDVQARNLIQAGVTQVKVRSVRSEERRGGKGCGAAWSGWRRER